jgi:hypothetical protein
MSIPKFQRHFATKVQCTDAMKRVRWPKGFRCPRCDDARHYLVSQEARKLFQSIGCGHQGSSTDGTTMEHSNLPWNTWFLAIHLISQAKTGISVLALKRDLVVSYPTAWLLHQKIIRAMDSKEAAYLLDGTVQFDDAYLGGESSGGKAGRGSENRGPFAAALSLDVSGGLKHLKLDLVSGFASQAIGQWAKARVKPSRVVSSDGLGCFTAVADASCTRIPRAGCTLKPKDLPDLKQIDTVLGNQKTTLPGAFRALRWKKHRHIYLTALAYRFCRRFDLSGFVASIILDLARSKPIP